MSIFFTSDLSALTREVWEDQVNHDSSTPVQTPRASKRF